MTDAMPESTCAQCGYQMDAATSTEPDDARPTAGALLICFGCGHLTVFADDLSLRELTQAELVKIALDTKFTQWYRGIQKGIREVHREGEE